MCIRDRLWIHDYHLIQHSGVSLESKVLETNCRFTSAVLEANIGASSMLLTLHIDVVWIYIFQSAIYNN